MQNNALLKRPAGRLFWKLFATLWLAMLLTFAATLVYLWLTGLRLPPRPDAPTYLPWAAAALMSLTFSAAVAWYLARPLRHLRWGMRRAAEERFDTRLTPLMGRRSDEITDLATEFDAMAARLQQLTDTRRTLLHDLSHELRSPLARMQAGVGLWRQTPDDGAQLAARVQCEVERLDALVEELLTLHRLESACDPGGEPLLRETIDLADVLDAIVADAAFEALAAQRRVVLHGAGSFLAHVNADLVYRALENVVRNAIRYTPGGGCVDIETRVVDGGAALAITVSDRGPGVPADKLSAIFEPFVRLGGGSGGHRGTGLGLAIARRAIVSHGGRIEAAPRSGGGLTVQITVPAGHVGAGGQQQ